MAQAFTPLFELGRTVMTRAVEAHVCSGAINPVSVLRRHITGDWGNLSDDDKRLNDSSIKDGRLMSAYEINPQLTLWVITEWDRSATTLLLPSDY